MPGVCENEHLWGTFSKNKMYRWFSLGECSTTLTFDLWIIKPKQRRHQGWPSSKRRKWKVAALITGKRQLNAKTESLTTSTLTCAFRWLWQTGKCVNERMTEHKRNGKINAPDSEWDNFVTATMTILSGTNCSVVELEGGDYEWLLKETFQMNASGNRRVIVFQVKEMWNAPFTPLAGFCFKFCILSPFYMTSFSKSNFVSWPVSVNVLEAWRPRL